MNEVTENKKPWWKSKTIIGGAVVLVVTIAEALGLVGDISPDDKALVTDNILKVLTGIGGVVAIYGRVKAEQKIGKSSDK